jgi:DNA-directed RNA polymerase specialized sigma24 family protein
VLYRLALHAQSLFTAAACLGRRDELVLPGGDSAADLVSATLLKLLDPLNTSVTWSSTNGPPTTSGVLAYLREVLRRDFLDLVRSKRAKTSVYPDDERTGGEDLSESSLDQRTSSFGNPEDEHLRRERLVWLVAQFKDYPELLEIVRLQMEPDGYNAFSSQELAERLSTTVVEIENRRRRVIRRFEEVSRRSSTRRDRTCLSLTTSHSPKTSCASRTPSWATPSQTSMKCAANYRKEVSIPMR